MKNQLFNSSNEVFNAINKYFKDFTFTDGEWYLPDSIPSKKLRNAQKTVINNFDKDEFPLLYCDTTLMGGGSDCVVITNKRLKCKAYVNDAFSIFFEDDYEIGYFSEIEVIEEHNWLDKLQNQTAEFLSIAGGKITSTTVKIATKNKLGKGADLAIEGGFKLFSEWLKVENNKTIDGKKTKLVKKKIFALDFKETDYEKSHVIINCNDNLLTMDSFTNRFSIANFLMLASKQNVSIELENLYNNLSPNYKSFLKENFNQRIKV